LSSCAVCHITNPCCNILFKIPHIYVHSIYNNCVQKLVKL
jgi:hypothetical protein